MNEKIIINIFYVTFAIAFIGLICTIGVYGYFGHIVFNSDIDPALIGTFGDFIGGFLGTIFTISTTLLVWLTYQSQKQELSKTNELASKQFDSLVLQQFESTFFNLVNSLHGLPDTIQGELPKITLDFNDDPQLELTTKDKFATTTHKGREFFIKASEGLLLLLSKKLAGKKVIAEKDIEDTYNIFYTNYLDELDNYFRFFYNILKFIDKSSIEDKFKYAEFLQAQLSKYELCLIYYNGLSWVGKPKLYPLLEKYNFLENINPIILFKESDIHLRLYPTITFRFLSNEEKLKRIINAIENNSDALQFNAFEDKMNFYFSKYNCGIETKKAIMERVKISKPGSDDADKIVLLDQ